MTPASEEADVPSSARQVVSEYRVYWNHPVGKRLLLLQFPSKSNDAPFSAVRHSAPLEVRVKPASGLLEVDVPIDVQSARYDRERGAKFHQALRHSKTLQTGGEYGLPGGFGIYAQARQARPSAGTSAAPPRSTKDEAPDGVYAGGAGGGSSSALTKLTMGGRLRFFGGDDPTYAIGVFRGDELHLSKIDGICSLQPQFHHLDAIVDNDRVASRAGGAEHPGVESEARAVNMSVKSTELDQFDVGEVDRTLRMMQEEAWQRLEWIDEADARAYSTLDDHLTLADPQNAPSLVSAMTERQYLDAISAPRIDPFRQGKRVIINRPWTDDDLEGVFEEGEHSAGDVAGSRVTGDGSKSAPVKLKVEAD